METTMPKAVKKLLSPREIKRKLADPSDDYAMYGFLGRTTQYAVPKFLQGIFAFSGQGFGKPISISETLSYRVPSRKRAQLIYFRAGNSSENLIDALVLRNGEIMRRFPLGANSVCHIPLAVVEDLLAEMLIELKIAAPEGAIGTLIVDIGFLEL